MINIENIDDNWLFKWSIVRYLNPTDYNSRKITKGNINFPKKRNFEDITFPVKIRQNWKKNSICIFFFENENKEKHPIYVSKKCCEEKHVYLLLTGEKKHYVLVKNFNTFMYDHTSHRGSKHFCRFCLQFFSTKEILKRHIKDCFEFNGKQMLNRKMMKER